MEDKNEFERMLHTIAKKQGRTDRNLNRQRLIGNAFETGYDQLKDFSVSDVEDLQSLSVYFRNLESHLIGYIELADIIVGCVAWLTSDRILRSLQSKIAVSIIVQKEDFLRPDDDSGNDFRKRLRNSYNSLPPLYRSNKATAEAVVLQTDTQLSEAIPIDPIRCVGFARAGHRKPSPLMHHKFLVFCKYENISEEEYQYGKIKPYAVWSGSYNLTQNSNYSFENAFYLEAPSISSAYFSEWGQVASLSEPLDWDAEWVNPEYSVGTGT